MLKLSSMESGEAALVHLRPSFLCSRRAITVTPNPIQVLDSMHVPIFAPLIIITSWEEEGRGRGKKKGVKVGIVLLIANYMGSVS